MEMLLQVILIMILMMITITDIRNQVIPNKIMYPGLIFYFVIRIVYHPLPLWTYLLGGLLGGGFFWLLAIVSRGGIGGGDIKLMALIGLAVGIHSILSIMFLSFLLVSLLGMMVWLVKGRSIQTAIPFGPFIAGATVWVYLV